jgi:hypothetical protein
MVGEEVRKMLLFKAILLTIVNKIPHQIPGFRVKPGMTDKEK